jgi:PTH1 family peptidyl-tRNA hydrolase
VGQLRIRKKGSAGGHNGIKNIIAQLGTQNFQRIKIGVGDKPKEWDLVDWVLGRFPKEQEKTVREALGEAYQAVQVMIEEGPDAAMNRYNKKKNTEI